MLYTTPTEESVTMPTLVGSLGAYTRAERIADGYEEEEPLPEPNSYDDIYPFDDSYAYAYSYSYSLHDEWYDVTPYTSDRIGSLSDYLADEDEEHFCFRSHVEWETNEAIFDFLSGDCDDRCIVCYPQGIPELRGNSATETLDARINAALTPRTKDEMGRLTRAPRRGGTTQWARTAKHERRDKSVKERRPDAWGTDWGAKPALAKFRRGESTRTYGSY